MFPIIIRVPITRSFLYSRCFFEVSHLQITDVMDVIFEIHKILFENITLHTTITKVTPINYKFIHYLFKNYIHKLMYFLKIHKTYITFNKYKSYIHKLQMYAISNKNTTL